MNLQWEQYILFSLLIFSLIWLYTIPGFDTNVIIPDIKHIKVNRRDNILNIINSKKIKCIIVKLIKHKVVGIKHDKNLMALKNIKK